MGTEENKVLYRRYIEEGFNHGQLALLDEVLTSDYVNHDAPPGSPPGAAGVKQIITMFRTAFPDLQITLEEVIAEGTTVTSRSMLRGTHRGPLFGIAPTGRSVTMSGLTMVHVEHGQIKESWVKNDNQGLMQQLGATPTQPGRPS